MKKTHPAPDPDIITELSAEDRERLSQHAIIKDYPKGAVISSPGEKGRYVYYMLQGRVKIYDLSIHGREIVFRICGPKSFFGIAEIFGGHQRQVFAEATEPAKVMCIQKPAFESLINTNPKVALLVIRILGNRVRQAHRSIKGFVFSDARSRMAQLLVKLAQIDGQRQADGSIRLRTKLTHQEMADMIGAIRQTVSEIMNDLKKQGYLKTDRGIITVLKRDGLESLILD